MISRSFIFALAAVLGTLASTPVYAAAGAAGTTKYVVVLREPALATRYAASKPPPLLARSTQLDPHSMFARGYVQQLEQRQAEVVTNLANQLARPLTVTRRFQHALNGVVLTLTAEEAARVAQNADVAFVEAEQILPFTAELAPSFIGADTIWDGSASGGVASQGEGVVVGIIDSGVNWQSPSFAALAPVGGYQHVNPLGAGNYLGGCATTAPNPDVGHCNAKLIGMYNLVDPTISAEDTVGHGSHTASIAAGNHRIADIGVGLFAIAGIAPRANIVVFSCLQYGGCNNIAAAAAADRAVTDGVVDVLNFSVAGGTSPWEDVVSLALLGATEAGIFVAAAAGNDGPDRHSVDHLGPWLTTVAASTMDFTTGFDFSLHLPGGAPVDTQHLGVHPGQDSAQTADVTGLPIIRSPGFGNGANDGCAPFPTGTFERNGVGALAVLRMDVLNYACGTGQRYTNALAAGASAVLLVDADTYVPITAIPNMWAMLLADWERVWEAVQTNPLAATASVRLPMAMYPHTGDHVANFSGRGPIAATDLGGQTLLKPDLSAPGVEILAAYIGADDAVAFMNGTSMASPHIAGAAALLHAVHPLWSPMEIKSALMTASWDFDLVAQLGGPIGHWAYGTGRVDLQGAVRAGLLLDESGTQMRAADPALGTSATPLSALNLASVALAGCGGDTCVATRRVRNPLTHSVHWVADMDGLAGIDAVVTPTEFTLAAGAEQVLEVAINPATLAGGWTFGVLRLQPDTTNVASAHLPVGIHRDGGMPLLLLSTTRLTTVLPQNDVLTRTLSLVNRGTGAVHWSVDTTSLGCEQPGWAQYAPLSGTLLAGGQPRTMSVTLDAAANSPGSYAATLCFASDDPGLPMARVELVLQITGNDQIFGDGFDLHGSTK